MTTREDFHLFIDDLDDEMVKPALHAMVDSLPAELLHAALKRMRALHDRAAVVPPELSKD